MLYAALQHLISVVRGFVGFPQKSQIFVDDFSLVLHDPRLSPGQALKGRTT
jgi:hypothetical protein